MKDGFFPLVSIGRVRLACFALVILLHHTLPISLLILRKKPTVLQSTKNYNTMNIHCVSDLCL